MGAFQNVFGSGGGSGFTAAEVAQIRYRLGIDGDRTAPTESEAGLSVLLRSPVVRRSESPTVDDAGLITITQRDDYNDESDSYPIDAGRIDTVEPLLRPVDPPVLSFVAKQKIGKGFGKVTITGTAYAVAVAGEATQFDLLANLTAAALDVPSGCYAWQIKAIYPAGDRVTLLGGDLQVNESTDLSV
ncbi:hypothetical protein [Allorhodopirellula heiligendammensis]|uniref:Uncharacterized protein n=1 Tax=Allorhodopirellula heiligendammensis TaxID=2714739 RepID=A0A5C6C3B2_9BACT|nr:hypothetical protein [Allorhodopirellula heiligendammensis]TWU18006.1 hypothetical protein Poly21_01590 [Allorhodopirellula heiligendammensis]